MSRLSRMTCSRKIRPEIGVSSIWVRENSAYRIDMSWRWPAARSAAVNGCGESGQPLARQRIDIRWPQPVGVLVIALIGGVRIHRIRPTFDKRRR
jgi:hypothetical protein